MKPVLEQSACVAELKALTVAVVGLGLIGGSLTRCLKEQSAVAHTVGYTLDPNHAKLGVELGVVDEAASSIEATVKNADIVVLAVPVQAFEAVLEAAKPHLKERGRYP